MMVGDNLDDTQLQQIVDKTILEADKDKDGKISFEEFVQVCSYLAGTSVTRTITFSRFCWRVWILNGVHFVDD
tara:strand:- start:216 stop:434 length:219 start_codon:yes stop_codon:yes gene_type:complete